MDSDEFEKRMRRLEYFHALRCLPGAWMVMASQNLPSGQTLRSHSSLSFKI